MRFKPRRYQPPSPRVLRNRWDDAIGGGSQSTEQSSRSADCLDLFGWTVGHERVGNRKTAQALSPCVFEDEALDSVPLPTQSDMMIVSEGVHISKDVLSVMPCHTVIPIPREAHSPHDPFLEKWGNSPSLFPVGGYEMHLSILPPNPMRSK